MADFRRRRRGDTPDEFRGLHISDDEVDGLMPGPGRPEAAAGGADPRP